MWKHAFNRYTALGWSLVIFFIIVLFFWDAIVGGFAEYDRQQLEIRDQQWKEEGEQVLEEIRQQRMRESIVDAFTR